MTRLTIKEARAAGNLTVDLLFSDNTRQKINIGDFIKHNPHPQYNKYLDEKEFQTFTLDDGNIVWGEDWDMVFPVEDLYSGKIS